MRRGAAPSHPPLIDRFPLPTHMVKENTRKIYTFSFLFFFFDFFNLSLLLLR
jgi:hypothetical protein